MVSRWNIVEKEENRAFHRFLMTQNENGTISRQELVSMIPVLLLDVKSHHKVLDICASPGSKTKQVLSMMHKQAGPLPSGMVIANEYDPARCDKLCHNVGRVMSPCLITGLVINNVRNHLLYVEVTYEAMSRSVKSALYI